MEPIDRHIQKKLGNYNLIASLKEDLLKLELLSLIDGQPYGVSYTSGTLPSPAKKIFNNVLILYEVIEQCLNQGKNIEATDLASIIIHHGEGKTTLQLTEIGTKSLSERGMASMIEVLLKDQCQLRTTVQRLTSQLRQLQFGQTLRLASTIDTTTPFFSDFELSGSLISHKKQETWSALFLKTQLTLKNKCQFQVQLVKFKNRSLMVGLGTASQKKLQNSHSYMGSILMCLSEGQTSIYQRGGRNKATRGIVFQEGDRIKVKIDMQALTISWWMGEIMIIWTRIPKDLVEKQLSPKIEMMGVEDQIRFC